jgi:3-oxoadipate enol-lactonase
MTVALNHQLDGTADGPVLVLGNSLGTSLAMWDPVVDRLADRFRMLRYDHRGQGASPVPEGPYAPADLGADVLALLDRLELGAVAYAGVSVGGMVGLWLAAHAPERISHLAAFCSSAHPGNPAAWRTRAATVRDADGTEPIAPAVVSRWLTPEFAAQHPDVGDRLLALLRASPPTGYAEICEMLATLDLRADLVRISAATLVVAGAQDEALAPPHSELIAAQVPGARYELLDPAAHIPMAEAPDRVAALIRELVA